MKKIKDPTTGILGIDLGNTIIRNRVVIPRALETLSRLEVVFGKRMHIISRVTPEQQVRAEAFMRTEDFLASTKITPIDNISAEKDMKRERFVGNWELRS
jgi:hypothetical protein